MSITNDSTLTLLQKGLDALSVRETAISHNIANIETPRYKAIDVSFENSLRKALRAPKPFPMARTNPHHLDRDGEQMRKLDAITPRLFQRTDTAVRKDGNNVDVELEMVKLAETATRYQALTALASKKLALLRMVARETR